MWRKPTEAKPSSKPPSTPAPVPAKSQDQPPATAAASPVATVAASTPIPVSAPPAAPAASTAPAAPAAISGGSSTISRGLKIRGEITGASDLLVEGETQGKIRITNGRVTIGENGRVNADIDAREIVVNGTVQGNLKASDTVRLGPNSQVEGSILTRRIGIDDGARLRGNVEMTRAGDAGQSAEREPVVATAAARAASASGTEE